MKIINPNAQPVADRTKSPVTEEDKALLSSSLASIADKEAPTFDELRAAIGEKARGWTDGYLHQAAVDLGLTVER